MAYEMLSGRDRKHCPACSTWATCMSNGCTIERAERKEANRAALVDRLISGDRLAWNALFDRLDDLEKGKCR